MHTIQTMDSTQRRRSLCRISIINTSDCDRKETIFHLVGRIHTMTRTMTHTTISTSRMRMKMIKALHHLQCIPTVHRLFRSARQSNRHRLRDTTACQLHRLHGNNTSPMHLHCKASSAGTPRLNTHHRPAWEAEGDPMRNTRLHLHTQGAMTTPLLACRTATCRRLA